MRIAISVALLESEPKGSFKRAYLTGLLQTLQQAGHDLLLLSTHWGQEKSSTICFDDCDLQRIECWNFPANRLPGGSATQFNEYPKIANRLQMDERGFSGDLTNFLLENLGRLDFCFFLSLDDPFALMAPLVLEEKAIIFPLLISSSQQYENLYSERALKHVGRIACSTQSELRYVQETFGGHIAAKCFLIGLPGAESFKAFLKPMLSDASVIDASTEITPPLSLATLQAFATGKSIRCTPEQTNAADVVDSVGGWVLPAEAPLRITEEDRLSRERNARNYFEWITDPLNFVYRLRSSTSNIPQDVFASLKGRRVIIAYRFVGEKDAVGFDVIRQLEVLSDLGINVRLFCEHGDSKVERYKASAEYLTEILQDRSAVLIYHIAISWPALEDRLINASCLRYGKYHNITPKEFFQPYSRDLVLECHSARESLHVLVASKQFHSYWSDSLFNQQELLSYGASAENCQVVPPFHKALRLSIANVNLEYLRTTVGKRLKLLCVGRIAPNKGHKDLIEATAFYKKIFDADIDVFIVGSGDARLKNYRDELDELVRDLGLADNIKFCGNLSHEEVATLYHSCDALVMLSRHEGFCVPVIEAQENFLPVIAYRSSALVETVANKSSLCDIGDYYAVANQMRSAMEKSKAARKMGGSAVLDNNARVS